MKVKIIKILKEERGEANYLSSVIYIFIVVLFITMIINVFGIITVKQQLDHTADQMVKQIQLAGEINEETTGLFQYMSENITGASNITYEIDTTYKSAEKIQLGVLFYIQITGNSNLGGFWNFDSLPIKIIAKGAGVSERYWKD